MIVNNGDIFSNGSINNAGSISNNGFVSGYSDITNSGMITNDGQISGLRVISSSGVIINNGYIQSENMQVSGLLKGNGDISVSTGLVITEAGTLAPGNSTGSMNVFSDLMLDGALEVEFDWFSMGSPLHDSVNVFGDVFIGQNSILDISFLGTDFFSLGQSFDLMSANSIVGDFASFNYDILLDNSLGLEWFIFDGAGGDILRLEVVYSVPVPAYVWLFMSGILGLITVTGRKKRLAFCH